MLTLIMNDYPVKGQKGFQDAGNINLLGVFELHDRIMFYLIILLIVVSWFFLSPLIGNSKKSIPSLFSHGNLIEFIWTITPAVILWGIGIPSLKLLYMMDEILDSEITIKAIGNQWYWSFEYDNGISFDSFMLDDNSLELGDNRLLTTDNSLVLPVFTSLRLLVTSNDVIHSFAVPSLGLKTDAIPGRLNSTGLIIQRESSYHGQCSELCGILHGFMPISVKGVDILAYYEYVNSFSG